MAIWEMGTHMCKSMFFKNINLYLYLLLLIIIFNSTLKAYLEKQRSFKNLAKEIQYSLQYKEYKQTNLSIEEFIRKK